MTDPDFTASQRLIIDMSGKLSKLDTRMEGVEDKLGAIAEMMNKMISVEQTQVAHAQTFERVFKRLDEVATEMRTHDQKNDALERRLLEIETRTATERRVIGAVWAALSVLFFGALFWFFGEVMDMRDRVNRHDDVVIRYLQQKNHDQ